MKLLTRLFCTLAVAACAGLVMAQEDFPSRPVMLIVPYPPGGAIDAFARNLGDGLSREWKTPVVIETRPGGNEVIAASALAKARPDGYTIMISTEATQILNPLLYKNLSFDAAKQIAPVSLLVRAPLVFAVSSSSPANNLREFLDMARARAANPMTFGSAGAGSTGHLPYIQLASDNQLQLTHVPYKGAGPMLNDLIAGHIDTGLLGTAVAEPQIKAGKVKGLAVSADKRLASLPMVPTFHELGIPDVNATFIVALSAPAGIPPRIADAIAQTARKVLQNPEFQAKTLNPFGFVVVASDPAAYAEYIRREIPVQRKRIEVGNISLDN